MRKTREGGRNNNRQPISVRDTSCFRLWTHKSSRTSFTIVHVLLCINHRESAWLQLAQLVYYISLFRLPVASFHPVSRPLCGTLMEGTRAVSEALVCLLLTSAHGTTGLPTAERPNDLPGCPQCVCNSAWSLTRITCAEGNKGQNSPPNRFLEHVEDTSVYSEKTPLSKEEHSLLRRPGPSDFIYLLSFNSLLCVCWDPLGTKSVTTSGLFWH